MPGTAALRKGPGRGRSVRPSEPDPKLISHRDTPKVLGTLSAKLDGQRLGGHVAAEALKHSSPITATLVVQHDTVLNIEAAALSLLLHEADQLSGQSLQTELVSDSGVERELLARAHLLDVQLVPDHVCQLRLELPRHSHRRQRLPRSEER